MVAMGERVGAPRGSRKVSWERGQEALTLAEPCLEEGPTELSPEQRVSRRERVLKTL